MKREIKNFFLSQINEHELVIEKTKSSVERNFLNLVKQNLTEKGRLIVKTDWEDYADDIKKEFAKFKVLHDPNVLQSLKPIQTKYEGKAIEEGREVFTYISDLNA